MIKKTLKNVRILEWVSFWMWILSSIAIVVIGYFGTKGAFEAYQGQAIAVCILSPASMTFWLMCFIAFVQFEDEILEKRNLKA